MGYANFNDIPSRRLAKLNRQKDEMAKLKQRKIAADVMALENEAKRQESETGMARAAAEEQRLALAEKYGLIDMDTQEYAPTPQPVEEQQLSASGAVADGYPPMMEEDFNQNEMEQMPEEGMPNGMPESGGPEGMEPPMEEQMEGGVEPGNAPMGGAPMPGQSGDPMNDIINQKLASYGNRVSGSAQQAGLRAGR